MDGFMVPSDVVSLLKTIKVNNVFFPSILSS